MEKIGKPTSIGKHKAAKRFLWVALATMLSSAGAVNAATIGNGSFELPTADPGSFNTYAAGSGSLTSWTITNANIDHIGSAFWQASAGVQSVDLNGSEGGATISQSINDLIVNQKYTVYFDMAGNSDGAPTTKTMDVTIGAAAGSFSFDTTGKTRIAMGWTTESLTFVAGATSGLLSFVSTTSGNAYGPALDNVRIEAVPIPAAAWLFGSALLGLAGVARRKRA